MVKNKAAFRNGYVGNFHGIDFEVDPNCPPGVVYLLNEDCMEFAAIDSRSKWQRFKDWIKRLLFKAN